MMKTFHLQFDGYWREAVKQFTPEYSGIYLIYTCRYISEKNMGDLSELIYIGKAENLRKRIMDHSEKEFSKLMNEGETLCYACAPFELNDLEKVENALVYAEKPRGNTLLKSNYSYGDARIKIEGACDLLKYTDYTITTSNDEQ